MKPYLPFLLGMFFLFSFGINLYGQQRSKIIAGTVIFNEKPLPESYIMFGANSGVITDASGSFVIETENLDLNRLTVIQPGFSTQILKFEKSGDYVLENGIKVEMRIDNKHVCSDGDVFTYPDDNKLVSLFIDGQIYQLLGELGDEEKYKEHRDQLSKIGTFIHTYLDQIYHCLPPDPCSKKSTRSSYRQIVAQISKGYEMLKTFSKNDGLIELKNYHTQLTRLSKVNCE